MKRTEAPIGLFGGSLPRRLTTRLVAVGVTLLVAATIFGGCGEAEPATTDSNISSTTTQTASEMVSPIKGTGLPQLVDIGSDSCVPCQMMAGELEELARQYAGSVDVVIIDVYDKENEALVRQVGVQVIPTQLFIDPDGKELTRHEGYLSKEDIVRMFDELGHPLRRGFGSLDEGLGGGGIGA